MKKGERKNMESNLRKLQKLARKIAQKRGWEDPKVPFEQQVMNMISEVGELWEWYRRGNPLSNHIPEFSGIEEELADLMIRIMHIMEMEGYDLVRNMKCARDSGLSDNAEFEVITEYAKGVVQDWKDTDRNLAEILLRITKILARAGVDNYFFDAKLADVSVYILADVSVYILFLAHRENYRLLEAINAKMKYNKTRSYRHGNKKA
jgi:NTP pyrophosphatase (non-canonical NTP hydrolase)